MRTLVCTLRQVNASWNVNPVIALNFDVTSMLKNLPAIDTANVQSLRRQ